MLRFCFFSPLSFHTFVKLKKKKVQNSIIIISVITVNVIITSARGMV